MTIVSWAPEVWVEGKWTRNQLRFSSEVEARSYAYNLYNRWTLPTDYRATPADEPVNYRWHPDLGLIAVETEGVS